MDSEAVAEDFVRARLGAEALFDFPGTVPTTLNTAYAYQDRAIALWPDNVAGWKVGRIGAPWLERVGEDRLVGPIFRRGIRLAPPDAPDFARGTSHARATTRQPSDPAVRNHGSGDGGDQLRAQPSVKNPLC